MKLKITAAVISLTMMSTISDISAQAPGSKPIETTAGSTGSTGGNAGTTGGNGAWGKDTGINSVEAAPDVQAARSQTGTGGLNNSTYGDAETSGTARNKEGGQNWAWLGIAGLVGLAGLAGRKRR